MIVETVEPTTTETSRLDRIRRPGPGRRTGLVVAAWFFAASITPSLVPRSWYLQGITSGLCAAYGYGLGVLTAVLWRRLARALDLRISMAPRPARLLRRAGWTALAVVVVLLWLASLAWHRQTARLVGLPDPTLRSQLLGLVCTIAVFVALVAAARGLRALTRRFSRAGQHVMRPAVATPVAILLVAGILFVVSNSVVYQGVLGYTAEKAAVLNASTPDGRSRPTSPLRSGSPASREAWDSLGRNGQAFVADGSSAAAIAAATGKPATEPIRVYAGLSGDRSIDEVADAVVAELHRTGGFDRDVLALMTTTGRGWVDEWTASSVEYLSGGDSAIAAMQYSFLPSAIALVSDRRTPAAAGQALLTRIEAELARRPAAQRPRLMLGGESLGAFGAQSAFRDADDMLARVDGAVWVGTPNFTPLWRGLTERRQGGSPEIAPVVDSGEHIRFATRPADLGQDVYGRAYAAWQFPRVVYAQHASDPISKWSADLITDEPDWLREPVGADVQEMRFTSFATFWQLTTDIVAANSTPAGHGHRYQEELVPAWGAVLGGVPGTDYTRIQEAIRRDFRPV
jgi:uncharacterized membrane protein